MRLESGIALFEREMFVAPWPVTWRFVCLGKAYQGRTTVHRKANIRRSSACRCNADVSLLAVAGIWVNTEKYASKAFSFNSPLSKADHTITNHCIAKKKSIFRRKFYEHSFFQCRVCCVGCLRRFCFQSTAINIGKASFQRRYFVEFTATNAEHESTFHLFDCCLCRCWSVLQTLEQRIKSQVAANQQLHVTELEDLWHHPGGKFVSKSATSLHSLLQTLDSGLHIDSQVAVDQLSLTVNRGQVLGLLGPNGAGKTTAMNLMTADFAPTRGRVRASSWLLGLLLGSFAVVSSWGLFMLIVLWNFWCGSFVSPRSLFRARRFSPTCRTPSSTWATARRSVAVAMNSVVQRIFISVLMSRVLTHRYLASAQLQQSCDRARFILRMRLLIRSVRCFQEHVDLQENFLCLLDILRGVAAFYRCRSSVAWQRPIIHW